VFRLFFILAALLIAISGFKVVESYSQKSELDEKEGDAFIEKARDHEILLMAKDISICDL
jgi:hypothetical protein